MRCIFKLFLASFISATASLAPLEQPDNSGVYFGTWVDRLHGDSVNATNQRLNYKPMSLFQGDVNLTSTLQSDFVDDIFNQITGTNTDAIVYLTVYPIQGFANVSDLAVSELATKVANLTNRGSRIFIRYASEMNGAWFAYGQQPTAFLASWKRVVGAIRTALARNVTHNVAFIWAPNSGNGYPFPNDHFSALPGTTRWDPALDTNKDGIFDINDDPYTPFYPGDDWVDWVGMSTYSYGANWLGSIGNYPSGWRTNDIPDPNRVQNILTGSNGWGNYNFYQMFCGDGQRGNPSSPSVGGKPFMVTETAATIHIAVLMLDRTWSAPENSDAESRVAIKQAWWSQILNKNLLQSFPKIKAVSFFEFIKFEERSWRDFTTLGGYGTISSPLGNDGAAKDNLVLQAFQQDLRNGLSDLIIWANSTNIQIKVIEPNPSTTARLSNSDEQAYNPFESIVTSILASVSYWAVLF